MQAHLKLGPAILIVAFTASAHAAQPVGVQSMGISTKGSQGVVPAAPDVSKVPSPPAPPVPIPYPNVMGSPEQKKQQAAEPALKNSSTFKKTTGDEAGTVDKKQPVMVLRPVELPKPSVDSAPSHAGAEVRTYTFKQAWPKKTESPKPGVVTVQPLPAIRNAPPPPPTPAWPSKIEGPTMVDISKARRPAPQQPQQLRTPVLPR